MTVQPTSLAAHDSVDVTARQQEVLKALQACCEATDQEIADHLGWTINRVTPRRGELEEKGLVVRARIVEGPYGRDVSIWRLTAKQLDLWVG